MKKRTKLADRSLPDYTHGEEIMNMVTHIVGGALGIIALVLCVVKAALAGSPRNVVTTSIYGVCMISLYTMSSVYHGLHPGTGKKVLQVIDHCTIYFLIAGTYTPLVLGAICGRSPAVGWSLFAFEWTLTAIAVTLTAIDLNKYSVFSMICYIGMGWIILPFAQLVTEAISSPGFQLLLWGGISYTIGAVLYGIGSKVRWMHSVFHIFVLIGSLLHFLAIFLYAI